MSCFGGPRNADPPSSWTCFGKVESSLTMQKRRYTRQIEVEAVQLVQKSGRTQRVVADDLGDRAFDAGALDR